MSESTAARILIVDDETPQVFALCNTLRDHGYETVGFNHPTAALEALRTARFDLLLSDLMMPEIDGISLLKAALAQDKDMIGIIMTGEGTIVTAVEAMKSGAFDYILKPFKVTTILPVLSRALEMRKLRVQNAELAQRIKQRTAELESANEELEAFSSSISHDLRTPLRHIRGYAEILTTHIESKLDDTSRRYLTTITESAERLSRLIDELLTFSRMGRAEMHRGNIDMALLVSEARGELGPETVGRTIEWMVATLPVVAADSTLMRQVWINLLGNAIKYTRLRPVARIKIDCTNDPEEGHIFSVADNGAGFDMHYAEKLFGVFQRLHTDAEFEGIGIGLANVRRIVSRHGGRAWAVGEVGEGATFYFTLPV